MKILEAFSGIGSQAKALTRAGIDYEIVNTLDWDINAIYAYDIIHNGPQDLSVFNHLSKDELIDNLKRYTLSADGKQPLKLASLERMSKETLRKIYYAIVRSKNFVNIQDISANDIQVDLDLLTYSFPCQDLSISGFWHGNAGGIDRDANNRSSMLWEVERLLFEMNEMDRALPKFLLMENVNAIQSPRHRGNFMEWQETLEELGYENKIYNLNAYNFGIPQMRKRTFMISVFVGNDNEREQVRLYFENNDLELREAGINDVPEPHIENFLRMDYRNEIYRNEAIVSTPNDTESRRRILLDNPNIYNSYENRFDYTTVRTITTKQDRHPNSGVIQHNFDIDNKSTFRYLTPRECFLLMGFNERDYDLLIANNFESRKNTLFLSKDKLNKLAGNSIVVNILEEIFNQINEIRAIFNQI